MYSDGCATRDIPNSTRGHKLGLAGTGSSDATAGRELHAALQVKVSLECEPGQVGSWGCRLHSIILESILQGSRWRLFGACGLGCL